MIDDPGQGSLFRDVGTLRRGRDGTRATLAADHRVGRHRDSDLPLRSSFVSGHHARIRWTGHGWDIQDLGSRNGTFVGARRIEPGERIAVARGVAVAFGDPDDAWTLEDDRAPVALAFPAGGGPPAEASAGVLDLPGADGSSIRNEGGKWVLYGPSGARTLEDAEVVSVGGQRWRFRVDGTVAETTESEGIPPRIGELTLSFFVSRDEEHVEIIGLHRGNIIPFSSRGHHYILLHLARQRIADAASGLRDIECGWAYQDDVERALRMTSEQFNLSVHRIRQQVRKAGVEDGDDIIERRRSTRQLRIGVQTLEVEEG